MRELVARIYITVTTEPIAIAARDELPGVQSRGIDTLLLAEEDVEGFVRKAVQLLEGGDADGAD